MDINRPERHQTDALDTGIGMVDDHKTAVSISKEVCLLQVYV